MRGRAGRTLATWEDTLEAPEDRSALWPCLGLSALVLLFFWPAVSLAGVYFFGDASHYLPRLAWTGEEMRAGRFPLWDPHLSLGGPHAASPVTMGFYPPHLLLFLVLPAPAAYNYDIVLHVLLAALGMFALARLWGQTRASAALAGMTYGLGGFTLAHLQHLNILVALAWLPVVFAFTDRFLNELDLRLLGAAILALGLQLLGGHPQVALYGLLALGAYGIVRLVPIVRSRSPGRRRAVAGLVVLSPAALALAAVFLLPFVEWSRFVAVDERFVAGAVTSVRLEQLVGFLAPFWHGGTPWRPQLGQVTGFTGYAGVLALGLAMVGASSGSRKTVFVGVLGLVALILSLGEHGQLFALMAPWPVIGWGRTPARFLMLVQFALALLAGFGLDSLRAARERGCAKVVAIALFVTAILVVGVAIVPQPSLELLLGRSDPLRLAQPDTQAALASLVGAAVLLWLLSRPPPVGPRRVALALSFAAAELLFFRTNLVYARLGPWDAYSTPPETVEAIHADGGSPRFYVWTVSNVKPGALLERQKLDTYTRRLREGIGNGLPIRFGLQSFDGGGPLEPPPLRQLRSIVGKRGPFDSRSARLVGLFGGRYVLAARKISAPELRLVKPGEPSVYCNEAALPRVYLVPASRVVASNLAAFAVIKRQDFDPRAEVVIEKPGPHRPSGPWGSAQAIMLAESANRLVVETVATGPAWLVLNDMYGPGWTATVDGKPTPVFRANALVRAVPVDGGQQRVEWKYAPASVRVGAWISTTALVFALGLVLFRRPSAPGGRSPGPSLP